MFFQKTLNFGEKNFFRNATILGEFYEKLGKNQRNKISESVIFAYLTIGKFHVKKNLNI